MDGKIIEDNVPKYHRIAENILERLSKGIEIPLEYRVFWALSRLQEGAAENGAGTTKNRIV